MTVTKIGSGVYRVEDQGRAEIVYVAGPPRDRWAFWNGRVYREGPGARPASSRVHPHEGAQALTAPMPATVINVLVTPGATVRKGDTVVLLEAMKMELPLRATGDAVVRAVYCREGQLVQAGALLVDFDGDFNGVRHLSDPEANSGVR